MNCTLLVGRRPLHQGDGQIELWTLRLSCSSLSSGTFCPSGSGATWKSSSWISALASSALASSCSPQLQSEGGMIRSGHSSSGTSSASCCKLPATLSSEKGGSSTSAAACDPGARSKQQPDIAKAHLPATGTFVRRRAMESCIDIVEGHGVGALTALE